MFQRIAAPFRLRILGYIAATTLMSALLAVTASAQGTKSTTELYKTLVGDWIGTCEQSTDGEQAENKYFHVAIKETAPNIYTSTFTYYRSDGATGKPIYIGDTVAVSSITPDGKLKNDIKGKGVIMVEKEPKQQTHTLTEVLTPTGATTMTGELKGKISVSGLPFGLGKNGQVSNGKSSYSLNGDTLTINQTIKAGFKVLFYKKNFTVVASSTAKRGTDVASVMKADHIAAQTKAQTTKGS